MSTQKRVLATLPVFLLLATPVFASFGNDNDNDWDNHHPRLTITPSAILTLTPTITPSVSPTGKPHKDKDCDRDDWKNHGQFVSCFAHHHPGGGIISEIAKSLISKKHHGDNDGDGDDVNPSLTPTIAASESPTVTPSISPTDTLSGTPSPTGVEPTGSISATPVPSDLTPAPTGEDTVNVPKEQLNALITMLQSMLNYFKGLL